MFKVNKLKNEDLSKKYAQVFNFTFGQISFAAFIITAFSGIFLAIPFDIKNPLDSISFMLLTNPGGVFFRNIHFWSAQLFLIFSILHIYDHLKKSNEKNVTSGVWLRLTFSLIVIFYVMLSGFIIKGDADAIQAKRIITSLVDLIPFFGKELSITFLGTGNDFQIIYVQHIATATIFLLFIIIEHSKTFWAKLKLILYLMPLLILIGYLFPPSLNDGLNSIMKGPWYFLGLQEILHWLSYPVSILIIILAYFIVVTFLPKLSSRLNIIAKRILFASIIFYLLLIVIGFFFRGENWKFTLPWKNRSITSFQFEPFDNIQGISSSDLDKKNIPLIFGRREGCLYCHQNIKGLSPSHNPEIIGCASCHSGNPYTLDKIYAHRGMFLIPGNLSEAGQTCGSLNCHGDIVNRLNKTIMTTLSGIVSVDQYAFGESNNLNKLHFINEIGHSNADSHLRNLCASCHLGANKTEFGPINQLSRGGGCNACHLNYDKEALSSLAKYQKFSSTIFDSAFIHPSLTINVTNDHCFGCHSRSGRISTNYEGWSETLLQQPNIKDTSHYRILDDGRVFEKAPQDIHNQKGMDCIDCHSSSEIMGDGNYYLHEEDQENVSCTDCHFNGKAQTINSGQADVESAKIILLRGYTQKNRQFLIEHKTGFPLVNTYINDKGESELILKNRNSSLPLKPPSLVCSEGLGHKNLSCKSCHTSWSPQCIGCHTQYAPNDSSFDLLEKKEVKGSWIETPSDYLAELPVLGMRISKDKNGRQTENVDTFIPGMILTIQKKNINPSSVKNKDVIFKRLFAPSFSHTIVKESRSCISCHNNPRALGYGSGKLEFVKIKNFGKWVFTPKYQLSKYDGLPEDGWIGFLKTRKSYFAKRTNVRPFNIQEQKNILTVGACLTCHEPQSKQIKIYLDSGKMPKTSSKCLLPKWNE